MNREARRAARLDVPGERAAGCAGHESARGGGGATALTLEAVRAFIVKQLGVDLRQLQSWKDLVRDLMLDRTRVHRALQELYVTFGVPPPDREPTVIGEIAARVERSCPVPVAARPVRRDPALDGIEAARSGSRPDQPYRL